MAQTLPTTHGYRAAVRAILTAVQREYDLTDRALADRIGCSPGTIRNAKSEHGNLSGITLVSVERRFGAGTIDPFLALGGSRATPLLDQLPDIDPILEIVEAVHRLIAAQHATSEHGFMISSRELLDILRDLHEARTAFDVLISLARSGVANAPPELKRWFVDAFEHPLDDVSTNLGSSDDISPSPAGFVEAAMESSDAELMDRYKVSAEMIDRWLREIEPELLDRRAGREIGDPGPDSDLRDE